MSQVSAGRATGRFADWNATTADQARSTLPEAQLMQVSLHLALFCLLLNPSLNPMPKPYA
jgi:hypothetical protein